MFVGPLPPAVNYGTWSECIEVLDIEDDSAIDFSTMDEIRVQVLWPRTCGEIVMELTLTDGGVTTPADGIIEWQAEAAAMGGLAPGTYDVRIIVEEGDDVLPIVVSSISIL